MKHRKRWIILGGAVLLLVLAVILWVNLREEPGKALLKIMSDKVDLQVRNVRYTEVGDGGMTWEVVADTARYQKKENLVFFETFTVHLVTKDGSTYVMTGDKGRLNTVSKDLEAEGNVTIVSPQGDRLTTDRLQYQNDQQLVSTEGPVLIEGKKVKIRGTGMVYSLPDKKVSILSRVQATAQEGLRRIR